MIRIVDAKTLRFALPAVLAVTTFSVAGACGDDDDHHADTGNMVEYCGDIETMATCESEAGCGWDAQYDDCVNTCYQIMDEQACSAIDRCVWDDFGGETTGGGESCHEPFT